LGDPVNFVDPRGEFGLGGLGIAIGAGWGLGKFIEWLNDLYDKFKIQEENRKNYNRWCGLNSKNAGSTTCREIAKDFNICTLNDADEATRSGAGLPGVSGGGPAPTDIWAPLIGETINAINK
jgi:hypothetical protein